MSNAWYPKNLIERYGSFNSPNYEKISQRTLMILGKTSLAHAVISNGSVLFGVFGGKRKY